MTAEDRLETYTMYDGEITIPARFLGIHAHDWPIADAQSNLSPSPTYGFGTFRTHDNSWAQWQRHHTSSGTYTWTKFDEMMAALPSDIDIVYTLYGTPNWAAKAADVVFQDAYGNFGGAGAPQAQSSITNYITTLLNRYPQITHFEIWNEPNFDQNHTGYFWGSAAEMAEMARTVYQAVKAINPNVVVLSPGFTGDRGRVHQFLNASDNNGGYGRNWVEGIGYHYYGTYPETPKFTQTSDQKIKDRIVSVKSAAITGGISNKPLYNTEHGYGEAQFDGYTDAQKADTLRRMGVTLAINGFKNFIVYSHDNNYVGNPSTSAAISTALNDIHTKLAGSTVLKVKRLINEKYRVITTTETFDW